MKTLTVSRNKSFQWSLGLHAGLLLIAFLPIMRHVIDHKPAAYLVEIGYMDIPEVQTSGSEGLEAKSPIYQEEPQPTTDQPLEEPVPVEDIEPMEQTTIAENNAEVISEVTTVSESEVAASETTASGQDEVTHADGGGQGSPHDGNQDGAAMAGHGGGGDGLEGDGIITRRVIYREDITQIAKVSGKVVLNVCIDRMGKVIYTAYDPEKTTITDTDIIKRASYIAARYRFESNYTAPARECGQLTFIFSIEEPLAGQ